MLEIGVYDPWPTFRYTGNLRAHYPQSEYRSVPKDIPRPDYADDGKTNRERES